MKRRAHGERKETQSEESNKVNPERIFRKLRHKIKKYPARNIIMRCISFLNRGNDFQVNVHDGPLPWHLLLLIKWTIQHGEFGVLKGKAILKKHNFDELIQLISDINASIRRPSDYDNVFLFIRSIAYQQFWWQETFTLSRLARQSLIFDTLDENDPFKKDFYDLTGLHMKVFSELAWACIALFREETNWRVNLDALNTPNWTYSEAEVKRFFYAISLERYELKSYLSKSTTYTDLTYEYYAPSPLLRYPLLRENNWLVCYSPKLLTYCLETFFFDRLKEGNAEKFGVRFGRIFEQYVQLGLDYAGVDYMTEEDLSFVISDKSQRVDFIVFDDNVNILIEVKGIDLPELGKISHLANVVSNKTKNSLIKAMSQACATIASLQEHKDFKGRSLVSKNYLIVVTHHDLFIENGEDFRRFIDKDKLDKIYDIYGVANQLPRENIYFLSINDFEMILELHAKGNPISSILQNATMDDSQPESIGLLFRAHLINKYGNLEFPEYLKRETDKIFNRIQDTLLLEE